MRRNSRGAVLLFLPALVLLSGCLDVRGLGTGLGLYPVVGFEESREALAEPIDPLPEFSFPLEERPQRFFSAEDYAAGWRYLLTSAQISATFETEESCSRAELNLRLEQIKNAYYPALWTNLEQACFFNRWEVEVSYQTDAQGLCHKPSYTLRLIPGYGLDEEEAAARIAVFQEDCLELISELYADGTLSESMGAEEKARALFIYVAQSLHYDETGQYHTGYDALVHKTASCQGYTALYNALCKLAGLPMESMTGRAGEEDHAWSRMFHEGSWRNIDCTWGDPIPDQPGYWDETWFWRDDDWLRKADAGRSFDADGLPNP